MVLVPYAGVKGLNALPPVRVPVPVYEPGLALQTISGPVIQLPGTIGVEWATVGSVSIPAEASTAIAGTGAVFAITINGNGGGGDSGQKGGDSGRPRRAISTKRSNRPSKRSGRCAATSLPTRCLCRTSAPPHQVANPDPALGPNQVRYQARFVNEASGEVIDVSINYDPSRRPGSCGTVRRRRGIRRGQRADLARRRFCLWRIEYARTYFWRADRRRRRMRVL